ncbi:hypothetical protein AAG906_029155 [Vitis piasezkii]
MNFMSYMAEFSRGWDEPNARDMGRMTSQPNAKALGEKCPTIPAVREMFGDCNTYNSNWRDHPNFSWKPQPPQYQQPAQAPQQASSLEQAMVNLSKISTLNKRMDEMQNDMNQKFDNIQYSISRLTNLNTVQEKENSPSQPYQNSMSIHEMEAQEGESSMVKEIEEVITPRSGKEVDLPTCKLEHKRIVIKEELMKKHMPPPFLQALYEKIIQRKFWMIKIRRNCKEIEEKIEKIGVKAKAGEKAGKSRVCEISQPLRNRHFAAKPLRNGCEAPKHERSHFAGKAPFGRGFGSCETQLWHTSAISQHSDLHFAAAKMAAK